jgi:hypothetical protein
MRIIEEGKNLEGQPCWFILEDANLISSHETLEDAENNI